MPIAAPISASIEPPYSGSPAPRMTLVHWKICCSSAAGMPIISQMICSGRGAATSVTKSHSPSGKRSSRPSTIEVAFSCTYCSTRVISFGVKPLDTIERSRKCFGSSMAIIEPKNSAISIGRSPMLLPLPLMNSCGLRLANHTSSWRTSDQ